MSSDDAFTATAREAVALGVVEAADDIVPDVGPVTPQICVLTEPPLAVWTEADST